MKRWRNSQKRPIANAEAHPPISSRRAPNFNGRYARERGALEAGPHGKGGRTQGGREDGRGEETRGPRAAGARAGGPVEGDIVVADAPLPENCLTLLKCDPLDSGLVSDERQCARTQTVHWLHMLLSTPSKPRGLQFHEARAGGIVKKGIPGRPDAY